MHRRAAASCRFVVSWILAFACFSFCALALAPVALAAPINGNAASSVAAAGAQFSPVLKVNVICQRIREGTKIRTFSCPDNHTCVNVAGAWKCRPPGPAPMACSVCYNNQTRDSDSCTRSGTLMQQSDCVNRVNRELMKCLGNCR